VLGAETALAARCRTACCRGCRKVGLRPVADFGAMPLSDGFVPEAAEGPAERAPLALAFCSGCSLVQLLDTLPAERLFGRDYVYLSSVSTTIAAAAAANAEVLSARHALSSKTTVVEIACNDGYLLRHFHARGIPVLGIEPAPTPAAEARRAGIDLIQSFFSASLARKLVADGLRPELVIASNVVAHVADPDDFVEGLSVLMPPEGVAAVEVHSLADLVAGLQFDTIYHEHACYFSATSIAALFRRHGLQLVDLERIPLQGGSLRLLFAHAGSPSAAVSTELTEDARNGLVDGAALGDFVRRVEAAIARLRKLILGRFDAGRRIAAYGAAAKGTMLLNHLGFDRSVVRYVVDRNPMKQGRRVPGVDIPIVSIDRLVTEPPDDILLLPWNLRDEILPTLERFRRKGCRIIVPLPAPEIY
jgi:hypothetical protein